MREIGEPFDRAELAARAKADPDWIIPLTPASAHLAGIECEGVDVRIRCAGFNVNKMRVWLNESGPGGERLETLQEIHAEKLVITYRAR